MNQITAYSRVKDKRIDLCFNTIKEAVYHNPTLTDFRFKRL